MFISCLLVLYPGIRMKLEWDYNGIPQEELGTVSWFISLIFHSVLWQLEHSFARTYDTYNY